MQSVAERIVVGGVEGHVVVDSDRERKVDSARCTSTWRHVLGVGYLF